MDSTVFEKIKELVDARYLHISAVNRYNEKRDAVILNRKNDIWSTNTTKEFQAMEDAWRNFMEKCQNFADEELKTPRITNQTEVKPQTAFQANKLCEGMLKSLKWDTPFHTPFSMVLKARTVDEDYYYTVVKTVTSENIVSWKYNKEKEGNTYTCPTVEAAQIACELDYHSQQIAAIRAQFHNIYDPHQIEKLIEAAKMVYNKYYVDLDSGAGMLTAIDEMSAVLQKLKPNGQ